MSAKTEIQGLETINLQDEILRENSEVIASEEKILAEQGKLDREVEKVLRDADNAYNKEREAMLGELGFDYKLAEATKLKAERLQFSALPQNRIMSLGAIKKVCLKYSLRFLPTRFYKGALDSGIGPKVDEFKALLGELPKLSENEILQDAPAALGAPQARVQFYIAAPSESFALTLAPKDPLLFCRLSLDKFFLVHKWGADLKKNELKRDIDERNWNSNVKKIDDRDYYAMAKAGLIGMPPMNIWAGNTQPIWISSSSATGNQLTQAVMNQNMMMSPNVSYTATLGSITG
jgi:hypothetical protein